MQIPSSIQLEILKPHSKKTSACPLSNNRGQGTVEYLLIIIIATVAFTGFYKLFNERVRNNFAYLGELLTTDLQTGKEFFDGWKVNDQ